METEKEKRVRGSRIEKILDSARLLSERIPRIEIRVFREI